MKLLRLGERGAERLTGVSLATRVSRATVLDAMIPKAFLS